MKDGKGWTFVWDRNEDKTKAFLEIGNEKFGNEMMEAKESFLNLRD